MIWGLLVAAAICDAKTFKIPNQLVILGLITGLYLSLTKSGALGLKFFCFNAIWPVILLYLLFILGGLGAGDIKLFSVMSTMVGPMLTAKTVLFSIFLAGSVALSFCIKERRIVSRKLHYSYYILSGYLLVCLAEEIL